ncbi:MAG: carboxymuconolactone decarboxylase family protein [Pseudomonadota bacterium]
MSNENKDKADHVLQKLFNQNSDDLSFSGKFGEYTVNHLFGEVWQGDELAIEERSLITCTILAALVREPQLVVHLKGAKNLGIPRHKIEAMLTHLAHYAGWPAAVTGHKVLNEVWPEDS